MCINTRTFAAACSPVFTINLMKAILFVFLAALSALAADAPKAEAPTLTAADREAFHEAQEALQADQLQATLGQAAAARLTDREKALEAEAKKLADKCGAYNLTHDQAGRLQCGTKPAK